MVTASTRFVPIAEGVFTWPSEEPRLIGARCGSCRVVTFPGQEHCPRCHSDEMAEELLEREGTLWTWTIQGFPPKSPPYIKAESPETFEPYGVGYVELADQVRVEARLTEADPDRLEIGMPVEMTVVPLLVTPEGDEIVTFAFRPTGPARPTGTTTQTEEA